MVNKTIDAVITALYNTFGDGYTYLKENNEQGLPTPCFLVALLRPTSRGGTWHTYNRVMPIVINYFPKSDIRPKNECYAVAESALEAVEVIEIEGVKVCGQDLEIQVIDENVLQIFVTYDFWTQTVKTEPETIETMDATVTLEK